MRQHKTEFLTQLRDQIEDAIQRLESKAGAEIEPGLSASDGDEVETMVGHAWLIQSLRRTRAEIDRTLSGRFESD